MKNMARLLVLILAATVIFTSGAEAKLRKYKWVQEVSKLDWQLLNWTSAWRGTTKPADPFILDRMEYDTELKKIAVYLTGKGDQASDENLDKSINSIISLFQDRFPEFEANQDLLVYYEIKSDDKESKVSYIQWDNGGFDKNSGGPQSKPVKEVYTW